MKSEDISDPLTRFSFGKDLVDSKIGLFHDEEGWWLVVQSYNGCNGSMRINEYQYEFLRDMVESLEDVLAREDNE